MYRQNNQGILSSGCVHHEDLNTTNDNFFLERLTTTILEPFFRRSRRVAGDRGRRRRVDIHSDVVSCGKGKGKIE